jgi:hypothetical protein
MQNETENMIVEEVTKSELMGLASWDRPRTDEELDDFRKRHEARVIETDVDKE